MAPLVFLRAAAPQAVEPKSSVGSAGPFVDSYFARFGRLIRCFIAAWRLLAQARPCFAGFTPSRRTTREL
jgi:hypothetical protein